MSSRHISNSIPLTSHSSTSADPGYLASSFSCLCFSLLQKSSLTLFRLCFDHRHWRQCDLPKARVCSRLLFVEVSLRVLSIGVEALVFFRRSWTLSGTKAIKIQAMAMAACQAQCVQVSNYLAQGSSSLEVRNRPATVSFTRTAARNVQGLSQRGNARLVICAAEGSGSCCGGSEGNGSGKQSCSSHGSKAPPPGVAGVGAEFENMVSRSTMQEFEKEYDSGEMQGTITRDVVADVMNEIPELLNASNEERFVDVDAVLSEAMGLANEDFVFDAQLEGTMV